MISKKIRVNGIVQGVFFRVSTKDKADELGIKGWVQNYRNRHDSIKIFAEGEEDAMEKFVEWCHEGPYTAEVTSVHITEDPVQNTESFEIKD